MPITIRPSDVVLGLAGVLQDTSRAARGIADISYEADRVSWVNRQLAFVEQGYEEYDANVVRGTITETPEADAQAFTRAGGEGPDAPEAQALRFGQATWGAVENNAEEFFQQQLEYITKTTTNKAAREEMVQHLTMKHIQNLGWLRGQWQTASDREDRASLMKVYDTVLASNDPWEVKIAKITSRVEQSLSTGRLHPDEAVQMIQAATQQAQYSFAANGAMEAMKEARDADAGETWLNENTPFWDGNPDARAGVLTGVRREFDLYKKEQDNELDGSFSTLRLDAEIVGTQDLDMGIQMIDQALSELRGVDFYDQGLKDTWTQRLITSRNRLVRIEDAPEDARAARDRAWEDREDWLSGWLDIEVAAKRLTPQQAIARVEEEFGQNRINGDFVPKFRNRMNADADPNFKVGLTYITEQLKGEAQARAVTEFRALYESMEGLTFDQVVDLAKSLVTATKQRDLVNPIQGVLGALGRADEKMFSDLEATIREILDGEHMDAGLPDNRPFFERLGGVLYGEVQTRYPGVEFQTHYIDWDGSTSGYPGMPIFLDTDNSIYLFNEEGKTLVLYRHTDEGSWEVVSLPEVIVPPPWAGPSFRPGAEETEEGRLLREAAEAAAPAAGSSFTEGIFAEIQQFSEEFVSSLGILEQQEFQRAFQDVQKGNVSVERLAEIRRFIDSLKAAQ